MTPRVAAALALARRHWAIGALLVVAALVYARTSGSSGMLTWDEAEYATLARSLVRGEGYAIDRAPHALRPPLLPLVEAASLRLAGRADDRAVHAATVALALLALFVLYAGAAAAYDRTTALAAAMLLGTAPWYWTTTAHALSEIPLLACFAAALFAWSGGLLCDARWFHASWACIGLALLTRYTALLIGPLVALLTLLELARGDAAVRRRVGSRAFLLAPLVGLLVVAPWFARQAAVFGDPLVGVREASMQLQRYLPGLSMPWWWYLASLPAMLSWPTVLLLGVGAAAAVRRRDRFAIHCLVVVGCVLAWFSCYRYKEPRLVSAMLPAAALLAALALTRAPVGPAPRAALAGILTAIALLNVAATRPVFAGVRTLGYPAFLEAMAFVRRHSAPDALLIGPNEPQMVWYADREVVDFPDAPRPEILASLLARAEWAVVTDFERGQKPWVAPLAARLPDTAFADGSAVRFSANRSTTLVVRPARLFSVLESRPGFRFPSPE
jgi:4-amino-4-deoxy-L-arabinose transferase-like glycosyltransferase